MAYGVKYSGTGVSKDGSTYTAEILKNGYSESGPVTPIKLSKLGIVVRWGQQGDDIYEPIRPSSVEILVFDKAKALQAEIFNADEETFRLRIKQGANVYWVGKIITDGFEDSLDLAPQSTKIMAIDGLGQLEGLSFDETTRVSIVQCVADILNEIGLDLNIRFASNWFTPDVLDSDDPLAQIYTERLAERGDNDGLLSSKEVLEEYLLRHGLQLYQAGGSWRVIQRELLKETSYHYYEYDKDGVTVTDDNETPAVTIQDADQYGKRLEGGRRPYKRAFKTTTVIYAPKATDGTLVPNGSFEDLDGNSLPLYWTKSSGALTVETNSFASAGVRSVKLGAYYDADPDQLPPDYYEAAAGAVSGATARLTIHLSARISQNPNNLNLPESMDPRKLYFSVLYGDYWLSRDGGGTFTWVQTGSQHVLFKNTGINANREWETDEFDTPALPEGTGELTIRLFSIVEFEFTPGQESTTAPFDGVLWDDVAIDPIIVYETTDPVTGVQTTSGSTVLANTTNRDAQTLRIGDGPTTLTPSRLTIGSTTLSGNWKRGPYTTEEPTAKSIDALLAETWLRAQKQPLEMHNATYTVRAGAGVVIEAHNVLVIGTTRFAFTYLERDLLAGHSTGEWVEIRADDSDMETTTVPLTESTGTGSGGSSSSQVLIQFTAEANSIVAGKDILKSLVWDGTIDEAGNITVQGTQGWAIAGAHDFEFIKGPNDYIRGIGSTLKLHTTEEVVVQGGIGEDRLTIVNPTPSTLSVQQHSPWLTLTCHSWDTTTGGGRDTTVPWQIRNEGYASPGFGGGCLVFKVTSQYIRRPHAIDEQGRELIGYGSGPFYDQDTGPYYGFNGEDFGQWPIILAGNIAGLNKVVVGWPENSIITDLYITGKTYHTGNVVLGSAYLSGDGGNEGLTIDTSGNVTASHNLQVGYELYLGTQNKIFSYSDAVYLRSSTAAGFADFTTTGATLYSNLTVNGVSATIGNGAASASKYLILNGGTDANTGAYINFMRGSSSKGYLGHVSAIFSGTSDDLGIAAGANVGIQFFTNGSQNPSLTLSSFSNAATFAGAVGIGIAADATHFLTVKGNTSNSSANAFRVLNSSNAALFAVRNDAYFDLYGSGAISGNLTVNGTGVNNFNASDNSINTIFSSALATVGTWNGVTFGQGSLQKAGIFFQRTSNYYLGELSFAVRDTYDAANVTLSDAALTLYGDKSAYFYSSVHTYGNLLIGVGTGATGVIINSATTSGNGPFVYLQAGSTMKAMFGLYSGLHSSTATDFELMSIADNIILTPGSGKAVLIGTTTWDNGSLLQINGVATVQGAYLYVGDATHNTILHQSYGGIVSPQNTGPAVTTTGIFLDNATAATSGVAHNSPAIQLRQFSWDGSASRENSWYIHNWGFVTGGTAGGVLAFTNRRPDTPANYTSLVVDEIGRTLIGYTKSQGSNYYGFMGEDLGSWKVILAGDTVIGWPENSIASTLTVTSATTIYGAIHTDGLSVVNLTPATSGQQQHSPWLVLTGNGWDTQNNASGPVNWKMRTENYASPGPIGQIAPGGCFVLKVTGAQYIRRPFAIDEQGRTVMGYGQGPKTFDSETIYGFAGEDFGAGNLTGTGNWPIILAGDIAGLNRVVVGWPTESIISDLYVTGKVAVRLVNGETLATSCTLSSGSGAPTGSEPNGSLFMRRDGAAGTSAYVRTSGAWIGINSGTFSIPLSVTSTSHQMQLHYDGSHYADLYVDALGNFNLDAHPADGAFTFTSPDVWILPASSQGKAVLTICGGGGGGVYTGEIDLATPNGYFIALVPSGTTGCTISIPSATGTMITTGNLTSITNLGAVSTASTFATSSTITITGASYTDSLILRNPTASTSGAQTQHSPMLSLVCQAWDTTGARNTEVPWWIFNEAYASAGNGGGCLVFKVSSQYIRRSMAIDENGRMVLGAGTGPHTINGETIYGFNGEDFGSYGNWPIILEGSIAGLNKVVVGSPPMNVTSNLYVTGVIYTMTSGARGTAHRVVGPQGAAIANPTDAASTQARLIDLLGAVRTHGLIAT